LPGLEVLEKMQSYRTCRARGRKRRAMKGQPKAKTAATAKNVAHQYRRVSQLAVVTMTMLQAALEGRRAGDAWKRPAEVRRKRKVRNPGRAPRRRAMPSTKVASHAAEMRERSTRMP